VKRRGRLACALGGLAGAGLVVLAGGRTWVTARPTGVPGVTEVAAAGTSAAPAAPALALAAAAAAVAVLVTGRLGRRLAAVVLALSGLGAAVACVVVLADSAGAAEAAVSAATGRTGGAPAPGAVTPWVVVALAGALLAAVAGGYGVARSASWPAPGRRFEAASGVVPGVDGGGAGHPGDAGAAARPGAPAGPDPIGAWDALSRGEDPTSPQP